MITDIFLRKQRGFGKGHAMRGKTIAAIVVGALVIDARQIFHALVARLAWALVHRGRAVVGRTLVAHVDKLNDCLVRRFFAGEILKKIEHFRSRML